MTDLNPAALALIAVGDEATETELNLGINTRVAEFGKRVSAVKAGSLPLTALDLDGTVQSAAGALPGATTQPVDENAALQVIMASSNVPQGVKAAIVRIITPSDPNHIEVASDGTPTELVNTIRERDIQKADKETAQRELKEERDPDKAGSLAKKLADAQATPAVPADSVAKTVIKELLENEEFAKVKTAKNGTFGSNDVKIKDADADEIKEVLQKLEQAVS